MLSFKEFLLESLLSESQKKIDYLIKNTKPEHQHLVTHAYDADPTESKTYTQWVLNRLKNGDTHLDHLSNVTSNLTMFEKYKNKAKQNDIHKHTIDSLHDESEHFRQMEKENPVVYETEHVRINKPATYRASQFFYGKKGAHCETGWCTAHSDKSFKTYSAAKSSKLHVFNIKQGPLKGKAFQAHAYKDTISFQDRLDDPISDYDFHEVATRSADYLKNNLHLLSPSHKAIFVNHTDQKEVHDAARDLLHNVNNMKSANNFEVERAIGFRVPKTQIKKTYTWPEANAARSLIKLGQGSEFHKNNQELFDSVKTKIQETDKNTIKNLATNFSENKHKPYASNYIFNNVIHRNKENTDTFNSLIDHNLDLSKHIDKNKYIDRPLNHALLKTKNKNNLMYVIKKEQDKLKRKYLIDDATLKSSKLKYFKDSGYYHALTNNPHHGKEMRTHIENVFGKPKKED